LGWVITTIGCVSILFTDLAIWQKLAILLVLAGAIAWNVISAHQAEEASNKLYCQQKLRSGQKLAPHDAYCRQYQ